MNKIVKLGTELAISSAGLSTLAIEISNKVGGTNWLVELGGLIIFFDLSLGEFIIVNNRIKDLLRK